MKPGEKKERKSTMKTEKFAVKFSDGEYLSDLSGSASELLTDARLFETKDEAAAAAAEYDAAAAVAVAVEQAPNWFSVGQYNRRGQLQGTWGGFAWTTWANHFATESEAQEKADELNRRDGIDPDNDETIYAVQEMEDDTVKVVELV